MKMDDKIYEIITHVQEKKEWKKKRTNERMMKWVVVVVVVSLIKLIMCLYVCVWMSLCFYLFRCEQVNRLQQEILFTPY